LHRVKFQDLVVVKKITHKKLYQMKTTLMVLALATLLIVSCSKDDSITVNNVSTTVTSGNWRVTYFWDTDHEETSNFNGYTFTFSGGNVLTAVNGGTTITGTWQTGNDNSTVKLIINFVSPGNFSELSEDWHVIERTDTKIRLQHVSGGSGGTDFLTFEKN
jgi:hypothetical protein